MVIVLLGVRFGHGSLPFFILVARHDAWKFPSVAYDREPDLSLSGTTAMPGGGSLW